MRAFAASAEVETPQYHSFRIRIALSRSAQVEANVSHDRMCGVDSLRRIVRADQNAQILDLDIRNGSKHSALNGQDAASVRCIHAARFKLLCAAKKPIDRKQQI
ncbi:hypothetical protein ACVIGA_007222 [Bradyrhizobium sp. USDA 3240]